MEQNYSTPCEYLSNFNLVNPAHTGIVRIPQLVSTIFLYGEWLIKNQSKILSFFLEKREKDSVILLKECL